MVTRTTYLSLPISLSLSLPISLSLSPSLSISPPFTGPLILSIMLCIAMMTRPTSLLSAPLSLLPYLRIAIRPSLRSLALSPSLPLTLSLSLDSLRLPFFLQMRGVFIGSLLDKSEGSTWQRCYDSKLSLLPALTYKYISHAGLGPPRTLSLPHISTNLTWRGIALISLCVCVCVLSGGDRKAGLPPLPTPLL